MTGHGAEFRNPPCEVLVVDDEEIVLCALRESLRQMGCRVSTASDAVTGLVLLKERQFAIIITDHQMPRLTGLEFLAQAKELQPDASRILVTAALNLTTVIHAINRAEVCRFLVKPWLREDLMEMIRAANARHQRLTADRMALIGSRAANEELRARIVEMERELGTRSSLGRDERWSGRQKP